MKKYIELVSTDILGENPEKVLINKNYISCVIQRNDKYGAVVYLDNAHQMCVQESYESIKAELLKEE